ncbi:hypothetical protein THIOSC15_2930018 [uncultured Thiomicrorhabdus sp.]
MTPEQEAKLSELKMIRQFVQTGHHPMEVTHTIGTSIGYNLKERRNLWKLYRTMPKEFYTQKD